MPSLAAVRATALARLSALRTPIVARAMTTALDGKTDLFGDQAEVYQSARPTYPDELVQAVVDAAARRSLLVDVGAGSGQLTLPLSKHFEQVRAFDKSERQLSQARAASNITYAAALAHALPVDDGVADVMTVAQTYHWLMRPDPTPFLEEARRVLKAGSGRLAILGYGICSIESHDHLERAFKAFYYGTLGSDKSPGEPGCWWDIERRDLDGALSGAAFGPQFTEMGRTTFSQRRRMRLGTFIDYLTSLSAYQSLRRALKSGEADPLDELVSELRGGVGEGAQEGAQACADDAMIVVRYPFFSILLQPNKGG